MKKPWYQKFATSYLPWIFIGFLFVGTFLDAVNKAVQLITPTISCLGSLLVFFVFFFFRFRIKKHPILWVTEDGQQIYLKSLGTKPSFILTGILLALWLPRILGVSQYHYSPTSIPNDNYPTYVSSVPISTSGEITIETIAAPIENSVNSNLVLWDISHGYYGSIAPSFAPSQRYSEIIRALEHAGYKFDINDRGILNLNLSKYSLIFLNASDGAYNSPYSEEEAKSIYNYVASGGGLVLMSDNPCCQEFQHLNTVGFLFGINLGGQPTIQSPDTFASHPIFNGVSKIRFQDGGTLSVSPPALAVAWTSSEPAIAVAEVGNSGRVVAIGDTNVWMDNYLNGNDNITFAINVFNWVSKKSAQ